MEIIQVKRSLKLDIKAVLFKNEDIYQIHHPKTLLEH
jgi:hypothetical protein